MKEINGSNFGLVIAFWLPGFLLLWALSYSSQEAASWLTKSTAEQGATVGGFLFATLASIALGLLISAVRQLLLDQLHDLTGVEPLDQTRFEKLKDKDALAAFEAAVQNHYRYYQYYGNTLVSIIAGFAIYLRYGAEWPSAAVWVAAIVAALALFLASRKELSTFRTRVMVILR